MAHPRGFASFAPICDTRRTHEPAAPGRRPRGPGGIHGSPRLVTQARQIAAAFGPVAQRVVTSGTAGGAAATLGNAALISWITANTSPKVQAVAQHADINLNVLWDGALGNPARTDMEIQWGDTVAGPQGPHDLFAVGQAATVAAMNFDQLNGYDINIPMRIQTPQVGATWRGTLLHELEAHTGLAYTTSQLIDKAIADPEKRPNFGTKITTTMTARSVVAEHRNWAEGGGGSEASMTRVVGSAPRNAKVAVAVDIAGDRIQEANANWPALAPDTHRQVFNAAMGKIRTWLRLIKSSISHPVLTAPETAQLDAQIANAANR